MSVGNLKDSGNQGNNFPWQLKMLQGLQAIVDSLSGTSQGKPRTALIERVSTIAGTINYDVYSASFANTGTEDALVNGAIVRPGEIINLNADAVNNYFPSGSLSYSTTTVGAELLITYII